MKDSYVECPVSYTESFIIRLIEQKDSDDLFECYHDKAAVEFMNDDNCDFGFYTDTKETMAQTVKYWIDFYQKRCFIRFTVVEKSSGKAVGTIEGFGGDTGVLRIDLKSEYETYEFLTELLNFADTNFHEMFGNKELVTKAVKEAKERRRALSNAGWEYIDKFRDYHDYYLKALS